jgi:hypothetical protein
MKYCSFNIFAFLSCFFFSHFTFAQEQIGLRIERYSGTGGTGLNPVNTINNPLRWDLNLVGMGGYASTNYAYFRKTNAIQMFTNADKTVLGNKIPANVDPNAPILDFSDSQKLKYVDGLLTIHGPAFNFKINDDIGVGVFVNVRAAGGTHGITPAVNYNAVDKRPFREYFELTPSRFSGMLWSEIGVNYAQRIEVGNGFIGFGANLKYLQGYQAVFLNTNGNIKSSQFPNDTFSFIKPSVQYGFTNDILASKEVQTQKNGSGIGFDLGFQYILPDEDSDEIDHKLILGASLLDLGRIHFSGNAESHRIDATTTYNPNGADFKKIKTYQESVELISQKALGDPKKSLVSNQFNIGLPAAISLQADYKIYKYNYVGAILTQRIPFSKSTITRPNSIAIHYRFEHRWGAVMLPISIVNYQRAQVGLAMRFAYLTLGSDNLSSIFGKRNLYGSDFYFALKFNPFKLGLDFGQSSRGGRKSSIFSRNKVKCPTF